MKKVPKYILLFVTIVLLVRCDMHRVDCPAFNKQILDWIPYQEGQVFVFRNIATNDTINLTINEYIVKHTTHYMSNEDCGTCDDFIEINDFLIGEVNLYISFHLNKNELKNESYVIQGSDFGDYSGATYQEFSSYELNGNTYSEVKEFTNSYAYEMYTKLIVAKGYGIVGLTDRYSHTWILDEDYTEISEDIITPEIRNISCD